MTSAIETVSDLDSCIRKLLTAQASLPHQLKSTDSISLVFINQPN